MFKPGEPVVYEALGMCKVVDIRRETFDPLPAADYYVLEMLFGARTTVYAPVHNEKLRIRAAIGREEVLQLIRSIPDMRTAWVADDAERAERFRSILKTGGRADLLRLIKSLYLRREAQRASGRKFHAADERLLQEAEKLLYEEFAFALGIAPEDVADTIARTLNNQ